MQNPHLSQFVFQGLQCQDHTGVISYLQQIPYTSASVDFCVFQMI